MVEVRKSKIHGRGVFAIEDIKEGTKLTCDVIVMDGIPEEIAKYTFPWSGNKSSMCMGFGSFFNHHHKPLVKIYSIDRENLTKTFIVLSDIKRGDELTLDYSGRGKILF